MIQKAKAIMQLSPTYTKAKVQRLMCVPYQYWLHLMPSYNGQTIPKTPWCIGRKLLKYNDIIDTWIKYHIDTRAAYRPNTRFYLQRGYYFI